MKASPTSSNRKLIDKIKELFKIDKTSVESVKAKSDDNNRKTKRFEPHEFVKYIEQQESFFKHAEELYKWNGHVFESIPYCDIADTAYRWLVSNESFVASDVNARACVMALVRNVETLPEKDKAIIACKNAYLRIRADGIEILPPSQEFGIRHVLNCDYQPERRQSRYFDKFVTEILPDTDVRNRVQEYVGSSLATGLSLGKMQLWIGSGANGKSCLARVVKALHSNIAALRLNDLDGFSLAEAVDASLLYCDELPTFGLHEETLKALITGEPLRINRKHKSAITACVTARIIAMGNVLPSIKDNSDGVWRRIEVVPFDQHVGPEKIDPFLADRIIAEDLSGVLNWALEGLSRVMKRGFKLESSIPLKMETALLRTRAESDSIYAWLLEEPVAIVDRPHTPKGIIYNEYQLWCKHGQIRALNVVQFWKAMRKAIPNLEADHRPRVNGGAQVTCCNLKLSRKSC